MPGRVRARLCCGLGPQAAAASPVPRADQPNTPRRPARPSPGRGPRPHRSGRLSPRSPLPTRPAGHAMANPARWAPAGPPRHGGPPAPDTAARVPGGRPSPAASPAPSRLEPLVSARSAGDPTRRHGPAGPRRSPRQHCDRQQHVRDQTIPAAGPPRTQHAGDPIDTARPCPSPRAQRLPAVGAVELPGRQPRLDPDLISLYRDQRVPPCIQHGPPAAVLHDMKREGRCRLNSPCSTD